MNEAVSNTTLGGWNIDFTTTSWSKICAPQEESEAQRKALSHLTERYWKPIYFYIRSRWRKSNEEAKDLTQEFFAWVIEGDLLKRVERGHGRFRSFLKTVLENFLLVEHRRQGSQKRGGHRRILSLDVEPHVELDMLSKGMTPEEVFKTAWKGTLLDEALKELEASYEAEGRPAYFAIFQEYDLTTHEQLSHEELANRYHLRPINVAGCLRNARGRLRKIIIRLVSESVGNTTDLNEELSDLFDL